jgi:hypothetical protein
MHQWMKPTLPTLRVSANNFQAVADAPDKPVLFSLPPIIAPKCAPNGSAGGTRLSIMDLGSPYDHD